MASLPFKLEPGEYIIHEDRVYYETDYRARKFWRMMIYFDAGQLYLTNLRGFFKGKRGLINLANPTQISRTKVKNNAGMGKGYVTITTGDSRYHFATRGFGIRRNTSKLAGKASTWLELLGGSAERPDVVLLRNRLREAQSDNWRQTAKAMYRRIFLSFATLAVVIGLMAGLALSPNDEEIWFWTLLIGGAGVFWGAGPLALLFFLPRYFALKRENEATVVNARNQLEQALHQHTYQASEAAHAHQQQENFRQQEVQQLKAQAQQIAAQQQAMMAQQVAAQSQAGLQQQQQQQQQSQTSLFDQIAPGEEVAKPFKRKGTWILFVLLAAMVGTPAGMAAAELPWLEIYTWVSAAAIVILLFILAKFRIRRKIVLASRDHSNSIAVLGTQASGKTVFFAAFNFVLGSGSYGNYFIEYEFGLKYLNDIWMQLNAGRWPSGTAKGQAHQLDAIVKKNTFFGRMYYRLRTADISGESFAQAYDVDNQSSQVPPELEFVKNSGAILLVMDPGNLEKDALHYYGFIQKLAAMHKVKGERKIPIPLAVVFTKKDIYKDRFPQYAAEIVVKQVVPQFYQLLYQKFKRNSLGFFFVSSVGDLDPAGKPRPPIIPQGIGEVMAWLLDIIDPVKRTQNEFPAPTKRETRVLQGPPRST